MKRIIILPSLLLFGWSFLAKKQQVRINKTQIIGSHNSYKEYIDTPLFQLIKKEDSNSVRGIEYSNSSLSDQLSLGLRSLEIDVYADAKGGKYAHPGGLAWAGRNPLRPYDPQGLMKEPGFKIFHMQDIDFRSNCLTLKKCLEELKNWSEIHPAHEPIFITINAKDDTIRRSNFTAPEKFIPKTFDELDKVIVENLGRDKLVIHDMVRGKFETLEKAVLHKNWPSLNESRGKFIFILDEQGDKLSFYIKGHSSLKERVLFVNALPGTPEAAIMVMNDPLKDMKRIQKLVKKGYIVRTRADADTKEAMICVLLIRTCCFFAKKDHPNNNNDGNMIILFIS